MMYHLVIYAAVITSIVFGKSYTIDNVEIQSIIGKDGIVQITEKRVSVSYKNLTLPTNR